MSFWDKFKEMFGGDKEPQLKDHEQEFDVPSAWGTERPPVTPVEPQSQIREKKITSRISIPLRDVALPVPKIETPKIHVPLLGKLKGVVAVLIFLFDVGIIGQMLLTGSLDPNNLFFLLGFLLPHALLAMDYLHLRSKLKPKEAKYGDE